MGRDLALAVIPAVLALWAQAGVVIAVRKYCRRRFWQGRRQNITGAAAAAQILERAGAREVRIRRSRENTYDPKTKIIRLRSDVHFGSSIDAIAASCHEAGHVLQFAHGYVFCRFDTRLASVTQISSRLAFPLVILGICLGELWLTQIGIMFFGAEVLLLLFRLANEVDASARAKLAIAEYGFTADLEEERGINGFLNVFNLAYAARTAVATAELFYFLIVF